MTGMKRSNEQEQETVIRLNREIRLNLFCASSCSFNLSSET